MKKWNEIQTRNKSVQWTAFKLRGFNHSGKKFTSNIIPQFQELSNDLIDQKCNQVKLFRWLHMNWVRKTAFAPSIHTHRLTGTLIYPTVRHFCPLQRLVQPAVRIWYISLVQTLWLKWVLVLVMAEVIGSDWPTPVSSLGSATGWNAHFQHRWQY